MSGRLGIRALPSPNVHIAETDARHGRLAYVAYTRARQRLVLCVCAKVGNSRIRIRTSREFLFSELVLASARTNPPPLAS